jgi:hypothetical protein
MDFLSKGQSSHDALSGVHNINTSVILQGFVTVNYIFDLSFYKKCIGGGGGDPINTKIKFKKKGKFTKIYFAEALRRNVGGIHVLAEA